MSVPPSRLRHRYHHNINLFVVWLASPSVLRTPDLLSLTHSVWDSRIRRPSRGLTPEAATRL